MQQLNEVLLGAWLRISTVINNSRLVSEMSYNESLICNILYRNATEHPEHTMTATDLCAETRILKSQMNRILTQLEEKKLITRERSSEDKRKIYHITALGEEVLELEMSRIERLYRNMKEAQV